MNNNKSQGLDGFAVEVFVKKYSGHVILKLLIMNIEMVH